MSSEGVVTISISPFSGISCRTTSRITFAVSATV